jgi:outer membrane biosynthesis protein TonB
MDIRLGAQRFRYDFSALSGRVNDAVWPYYRRIDPRGRLGVAVALALVLHALFFWMLISEHQRAWNIHQVWQSEDEPLPVDLWTPSEPRPQPEPVQVQAVKPHQVPPKPETQPKTEPEPQPQPQPAVQAAPPQPTPQPQTQPEVYIPAPNPDVKPLTAPSATPAFEAPREIGMTGKTKKKDRDDIQKADSAALGQMSDLHLHQVPADAPVLSAVAPSGLTPTVDAGGAAGGASAGSGAGRLGNVQLPGGVNGTGLKGRGAVSQALQNHDYCVDKQIDGKPIPKDCDMPDLANELARRNMIAKPGNADYWDRVNHPIQDPGHDDHRPRPGEYHTGKAARVQGECSLTDSCPTGGQ